jgi:YD repeat-containing protein
MKMVPKTIRTPRIVRVMRRALALFLFVCGWILISSSLALANGALQGTITSGSITTIEEPLTEESVAEELPSEGQIGSKEGSGGSSQESQGAQEGPLPASGPESPPPSTPSLLTLPFEGSHVLSSGRLAADSQSRTAYEGLTASAAVSLAEQRFGIQKPSWAPPGSELGTHVERYLSTYTASEERPGGGHTLVQSTVPLQVDDREGRLSPTSLSLHEEGGMFVPQNPIVPISIAKAASTGISFAEGTSVAPAEVSPSTSSTLTGDRVIWPGSGDDTDYMVEPLPGGVETSWQLRSEHSPEENSLVFHLAPEESLQMSTIIPGGVEVVRDNHPMLMIPPASANQADGEPLAVSYSISGDVLMTHVNLQGHIDFPVLLDPIIYGWYGEANNNEKWEGWHNYSTCGGCFGFIESPYLIQAGAEYNWPAGNYGEWFIGLPQSSTASITRVNAYGVKHQQENQSTLNIGIYGSNGRGSWTTDGYTGAMGEQPLITDAAYSGAPMAFCAQGAGGTDGGSQPLCEECKTWQEAKCIEAYGGRGFWIADYLDEPRNEFNWVSISAATIWYAQTSYPTVELEESYKPPKRWFNSEHEPWYVRTKGEDKGLGVASVGIDYSSGVVEARNMSKPSGSKPLPGSTVYAPGCGDPFCYEWLKGATASLSTLGTGVWTIGAWAHNAVGLEEETAYPAYIDNTPPEIATPSWSGATFGNGAHALNFSAQDGSSSAPQSGTAWLALEVDGRKLYERGPESDCPKPEGEPSPDCYGLSGSWTLDGEDFAPGVHTITLHAKDWVGNESTKNFRITIERPVGETQQVGPGVLNLQNGDYKLTATDASIPAGVANLTVSRTYNSQSSESGPLGPGWTLSTPDTSAAGQWQGLRLLSNGSVEATTTNGLKALFTPKEGGGFLSPTGFQTYILTEPSTSPVIYQITDSGGDYTQFEEPSETGLLVPTAVGQAVGAGGLNRVTYVLREGRTSEIIGPESTGVECRAKPLETRGCRVLMLHYATSTSAKGEGQSQWGEYEGRLASVSFTAWESVKEEMTTTTVAQYAYDKTGRLRAEWDPRISPALKVIYGYDAKNLLTALTPAGEQPFLFHYGTTAGASENDWLLGITRPGAATMFGKGEEPTVISASILSTTQPTTGTGLEVSSNGQWKNGPLTYVYQWELCNVPGHGGGCTPIAGATNKSFTPQAADVGAALRVEIEAQNAFGATDAVSAITSSVTERSSGNSPPPPPKPGNSAITTIEYHVPVSGAGAPYALGVREVAGWGQEDPPVEATAIFPPDEPQGWPAEDYTRAGIYYFDSAGRRVNVASPGGAIATTEYETLDNVSRMLTPGNRQRALEAGASSVAESRLLETKSVYSGDGTELLSSLGPQHEVELADGELVKARALARYHYDEGAPHEDAPPYGPYRLVTKTEEGAEMESGPDAGKEAEMRSVKKAYSGQSNLGWELHKPTQVIAEAQNGKRAIRTILYSTTTGDVTETTTPAGSVEAGPPTYSAQFGSAGSKADQLKGPSALTLDASGDVWVADSANDRIDEFSSTGTFLMAFGWGVSDDKAELETCTSSCKAGIAGAGTGQLSEPEGIAYDESSGDLYVSDTNNNRIEIFSTAGAFLKAFGWGVSNGKAVPETCTSACQAGIAGAGKGQLSAPYGLSAESGDGIWVADSGNSRLEKFSSEGAYIRIAGQEEKSGGEFSGVSDVTFCGGALYAINRGGNSVEQFTSAGKYQEQFGNPGSENGQFKQISRLACDPENNDLYVTDEAMNRIEIFSATGAFVGGFGSAGNEGGELTSPMGIVVNGSGRVYVVDSANNRIEIWTQPNPDAHTTRTIYYTAGTSAYRECGSHPEWAGLPCRNQPAQPEDNLSSLPITTTTYNIWDEPVTVTRTAGSNTRTATTTYDSAGRTVTSSVSSTVGKSVPTTTDEYSQQTGALIKQSTDSEGKDEAITSVYNSLGELTSYTDATGNKSTFSYDLDGRMVKSFDGKGQRTYTYSPITGELETLKDSAAGTFDATYNVEGQLQTQTYPNGMQATYSYNPVGQTTSLMYKKDSATWYEDATISSIHGEWLSQKSTLGEDSYAYDNLGRLIETQEEPRGKGCTTYLYTYDEDSDRTSETKREPGLEGGCANSGGTSTYHSYDTADRLMDPDTQYEPYGGNTVLPAADAGGHALESSYYASGALYDQSQNGQTNTYVLDPAGRVLETTTETVTSSKTVISHYSGSTSTPTWTEAEGGSFTRNITGINGALCAIQKGKEVTIQIANLHGDIVGTALDKSSVTQPTLSSEPTAFGVPTSASSSKYGWLGSSGLQISFEGTGISSDSGDAYIPQVGIHLEPEALSGSAAQDPINEYLADREEAEASSHSTGTLPGAVEPLPSNPQITKEFWEHPPWDKSSEGDPCDKAFAQGKETGPLGEEIAAWADVEWCWGGGRVQSVKMVYQKERAKSALYSLSEMSFLRWEESAFWEGSDYIVERTAIFKGQIKCLPDGIEGDLYIPSPLCPENIYTINLTFVLPPYEDATTGTSYENNFLGY